MTKKPTHSDAPIEALLGATGADFRSEFETLKSDSAYTVRRNAAIGKAVAAFTADQELQSVSRATTGSLRERIADFLATRPTWSLPAMSGAAFACTVLFAVTLTGREASVSPSVPMRTSEQKEPQGAVVTSVVEESEFGGSVIPESIEPDEESLLSSVGPVIDAGEVEGVAVEEVVDTGAPVDVFAYPDPPVSLDLTDVELAYEDGFDVQGLEGVGTMSDEDLFLMEDYSDEFPIA